MKTLKQIQEICKKKYDEKENSCKDCQFLISLRRTHKCYFVAITPDNWDLRKFK